MKPHIAEIIRKTRYQLQDGDPDGFVMLKRIPALALCDEVERQAEQLDSANNAIEPLNAELDYEREENARLRKALEFYANPMSYDPYAEDLVVKYPAVVDRGQVAREALRRDTPNGMDQK